MCFKEIELATLQRENTPVFYQGLQIPARAHGHMSETITMHGHTANIYAVAKWRYAHFVLLIDLNIRLKPKQSS